KRSALTYRVLLPLSWPGEAVTDAPDCLDAVAYWTEFLTQPQDMRVDCTRLDTTVFVAPHLVEKVVAREGSAGVEYQQGEQVELLWRQVNRLPIHAGGVLPSVDAQRSLHE